MDAGKRWYAKMVGDSVTGSLFGLEGRIGTRESFYPMMCRTAFLTAILASALGLSRWGTCQQQIDSTNTKAPDLSRLSLEQLGSVEVVTQSKEFTDVWHTASAIFVLSSDDIRRSGATSIPDALRLVPGVNVARVSGDRNWVVAIRGLGDQYSKYVEVLIDGRTIYSPLFGGVFWTINNVMLEDIDRIEVIRGPGGTIWGPNAVNGVINIITKSAAETQGALVSVGGGNVDYNTDDLRLGRRNKYFSYRGYALGFIRGPEHHVADQREYDDSKLGQIGFRMDHHTRRDELTIQGDAYISRLGDALTISTYTPPSTRISYDPTDASGGNLLGRWRRNFASGGDIYLQGFWSHDYRIGPNFGETRDMFDVDFLHRTPATHRQQFTYGAGIRISPSRTKRTTPTILFDPTQKTWSIYSAFLQDEVQLVPKRLTLTIGAKLQHDNYTGFEYQPNGRLLWTPAEHATLWAAVSRAVRTPDRVDEDIRVDVLAVKDPVLIYGRIMGDRGLRAERVVSYEGGTRFLLGRSIYTDVAVFHNSYGDLLALGAPSIGPGQTPLPPGSLLVGFQYKNGIRGSTTGFEVAPDFRVTPWWQIRGSFSYLRFDLGAKPDLGNMETLTLLHGSSPNNQESIQSLIDLPKRFEFDQTVRYVSALPAQKVKAYVTGNARLGWKPTEGLEFSVTGENLFQPHHAEFGIDPAPNVEIKRSVYAKVVWTR
jgi:iron complex outermembrane receptor protein